MGKSKRVVKREKSLDSERKERSFALTPEYAAKSRLIKRDLLLSGKYRQHVVELKTKRKVKHKKKDLEWQM